MFEYVNPAYGAIYGYAPHELIGRHFTIVVPECNRSWLIDLHDKFISGANEVRGEWPVQDKTGKQLFILADAVRIEGLDGRFKKVTFVTDITDRKAAEDEIARSDKRHREAVATKDQFFSIIAHDLRNYFQELMMIAELLMMKSTSLSARTQKHGKMIHDASSCALELLNNLLTWAQSQTGLIQCNPLDLQLIASVQWATQQLSNKAQMKGVKIEVEIPESLSVFADNDMLNTVLLNLLGNALKFTGRGNSISITAQEEETLVTVSICDTGVGMDDKTLGKLFRIETKSSRTGTDGEKGTGLGLLICKEFVETNGGTIWAHNTAGEGATFSFTLPKFAGKQTAGDS